MIYSFISLPFCPDPDPKIYADPDPGRAKTCGSVRSDIIASFKLFSEHVDKLILEYQLVEMNIA